MQKQQLLATLSFVNNSNCSRRWEPPTSFGDGSEHFIDDFWARIDTQGRDVADLREFSVGEEFFPSGPPRKLIDLLFRHLESDTKRLA